MLQIKNLSKSFSNTPILNDVNFSLKLGEICAIVGNNGSGKTTFLKCLSGLMNFETGSIEFNSTNGHLFLSDKLNIFGDLTIDRRCGNGVSSSRTRGLFYSGTPGPTARKNTIDYVTIQTKGNAIDFGDITTSGNQDGASHGSNLTRSVNHAPTDGNTIEYLTIATLGNTQDFGDATHVSDSKGGIDNSNGSIS